MDCLAAFTTGTDNKISKYSFLDDQYHVHYVLLDLVYGFFI